jgi:uncharacterized RDD family membrane protein YckC
MSAVQEPRSPILATRKRRIAARILDWLLLLGTTVALTRIFKGDGIGWFAVTLWITVAYFFLCESIFGQTLGKNALGLRVVRRDGGPPTANAIATRNVIRVLEEPVLAIIALFSTGRRRQRLGDLAAGTTVGVERASVRPYPSPLQVIYPVLWAGLAILFVLTADQPKTPHPRTLPSSLPAAAAAEPGALETAAYLRDVQSICGKRDREISKSGKVRVAAILKSERAYTRRFARLSAPPSMAGARQDIMAARRRFDRMVQWVYREMIHSDRPNELLNSVLMPRIQRVAHATSLAFRRYGIICN